MPRRYYRRRTVVVRPKKKWASNMATGRLSNGSGGNPTSVLVANAVQTSTPTPIILKVGNIKLQGDASVGNSSGTLLLPNLVVIVFYLPEGIDLTATTAGTVAAQHPEWIMAWKMIDTQISTSGSNLGTSSFTVSSRLKRNLNSGDRVCIGYMLDSTSSGVSIYLNYTAQYWTCAN